MTARYVVIESTPGYLPDDDDPAVFDMEPAARAYLRETVERYCEQYAGIDGQYPDVSHDDEWSWAYVTDPEREHDLGRYFEILECEES